MKKRVSLWGMVLLSLVLSVVANERSYIVGNTAEWMPKPSEEYVKHLTHLNLAFIRPKGLEGELQTGYSDARIKEIVAMGHKHGVRMGIAFGGGGVYIDSTLMKDTTIRATLISNLMEFVEKYNFDGVDNDWEPIWDTDEQVKFKKNQDMKAYYGIFTKQVRDSLNARFGEGVKELSASIMNKNMIWYEDPELMAKSDHFPHGFWEHLDFVSLMNYDDGVGSYHATYESTFGSNGAVAHWVDQGIPIEKMCVGLAFFGRAGFGAQEWAAIRYNDIIDSFPDLDPDDDVVILDLGGGDLSYGYNGPTTVKRKQRTADSLGLRGVMICFIDYDVSVDHPMSLLGTLIDYESPIINSDACMKKRTLRIENKKVVSLSPIEKVSLYLPSGRRVWVKEFSTVAYNAVIPDLVSGLYIVEVKSRDGLYREVYSSR